MERGIENEKTALMQSLGVPFVGLVGEGEGQTVLLRALCARELGERAMGAGDEVLLVGTLCEAEKEALTALKMTAVCLSSNSGAKDLDAALSPATRAVWVCADATADAVCVVRNFCNALDLWMLATVTKNEARRCEFEGNTYHVGAVSDVATGNLAAASFVCTKDALPYQLMENAEQNR